MNFQLLNSASGFRKPLMALFLAIMILAPLSLGEIFLDRILALQVAYHAEKTFSELFSRLDYLDDCSSDLHYFHMLFQNMVEKSASSTVRLAENLKRLKASFGNHFRIVVWDKSGSPVPELTDVERLNFILKKLYQLLLAVSEDCQKFYPGNPARLPDIDKQLSILKHFIGRFTIAGHLNRPMLGSRVGRGILGDLTSDFPLFWYNIGSEFSLLIFVEKAALGKFIGTREALKILGQRYPDTSFGCISQQKGTSFINDVSESEKTTILFELQKYLNSGGAVQGNNSEVIVFRKLEGSHLFGYARMPKDERFNQRILKGRFLGRAASWFIVGIFLVFCYRLRLKGAGFSVKWKLLLLFIYVNGFPLFILGLLGVEYVERKESTLIAAHKEVSKNMLDNLDKDFSVFQNRICDSIVEEIEQIDFGTEILNTDEEKFAEIAAVVEKHKVDEIFLVNSDGKNLFHKPGKLPKPPSMLNRVFATKILELANYTGAKSDFSGLHVLDVSQRLNFPEIVTIRMLRYHFNKPFQLITTGYFKEKTVVMAQIVGTRQTSPPREPRKYLAVLYLNWHNVAFQKLYLERVVENRKKSGAESAFFALAYDDDQIIADRRFSTISEIKNLMYKAVFLPYVSEEIILDGRKHLLTAIKKGGLSDFVMAVATPLQAVESEIRNLKISIVAFICLNLLVFSGVAIFLFKQFFIPLKEIEGSIMAIDRRDFRFRTNIRTRDEIEVLGNTLNETLEGMKELEVAKIIQDSLFPKVDLHKGRFRGFARTVAMAGLGGDYYDYFWINDDIFGVLVGDVSGHGIQAGLIMAMAKASIIMNDPATVTQSEFVNLINKIFVHLKKENLSKMMTIFYALINAKTGEACILNAGQCFPVIVAKNGASVNTLEIIGGIPLGIIPEVKYSTMTIRLQPGDTLAVFTDGFLEAKNSAGEFLGDKRFSALLQAKWHQDLEVYYQNIFQAYQEWSCAVEDDVTLFLVRYD